MFSRVVSAIKDALAGKPAEARSPHWPAVRAKWLKDHPACAACGSVKGVEVHHIQAFHTHRELELDPTNFITLCEATRQCHLRIGHSFDWHAINPHSVTDAALQGQRIRERR